ncbi:hypothetical protein CPB84DRAFT_1774614 [Gymnopilus junonius]|uniref:Uncharacterized protein n=1 Tax=Gymnopilus junonius TaxID=109634 RepID=A0A9P5NNT1_GYMJU|nr:hypothetical protein CPB84DRAFT_1774614 [Gymnopilus junonius]
MRGMIICSSFKKTSVAGHLTIPSPQLIAAAVAAFNQNNSRRRTGGRPQLNSKYIPAITMAGSAPIFCRIPVTTTLLTALTTDTYPAEETVVLRYVPPVPNPETHRISGCGS